MKTAISILALLSLIVNTAFVSNSSSAPFGKDNYNFRIELCSYSDQIPVKVVQLLREVGNIYIKKENNRSIYLTKPFKDLETAQLEVQKYRSFGFEGAKEIVEIDNRILSVKEYYLETGQEDKKVIRIYEN